MERLVELGQSPWLDSLSRELIDSGRLAELVETHWITGLTSNPTIFRKAITGSDRYDVQLRGIAGSAETQPYDAFTQLAMEDIRHAADLLRPVFDRTDGGDGFVSLELPPALAHDADRSVREAQRLSALASLPNFLIKVPATPEGVVAVRRLTALGVGVNITLLFSVERYVEIADAYLAGLEDRLERGESLADVHSVASFFVSRVDTAVDRLLPDDSPLRGQAAIANSLAAYQRFGSTFAGDRWKRLAQAGAHSQRLLWASTSTKDPAYGDVKYVEGLILPDTVNTMPEATLKAFMDHGRPQEVSGAELTAAAPALDALVRAEIDIEAVAEQLLREGLASFTDDFDALRADIAKVMRAGKAA